MSGRSPFDIRTFAQLGAPTSPPFSCCHNSYLVNLSYVKHLRRTEILLLDETSLPVNRAYWEITKISFAKFIGNKL
ncbi:LytTR family transcriptional regulator DNA-binding domain-containing protein [Desulfitobacterium hafniense]|uniref:LytTR family transcriptional regulator DNA-binding domain-containing protein n=1 Tax=Desulfitobacterium hafniense TaxID=49338 RepID=UPI001AD80406